MNIHYLRIQLLSKTVKQLTLLLLFLCANFTAKAQTTYYWVGGSGSWNVPGHWSLASNGTTVAAVPNVTDDVTFDAFSGFTAANKTITMNSGTSRCRNAVFSCTIAPTVVGVVTARLDTYGDVTLQTGMTFTGWTGDWHFYGGGTSSAHTINTLNNVLYNGNVFFENDFSCNWVVNGSFLLNGSVNVNLFNKTNTVVFNNNIGCNNSLISVGTVSYMSTSNVVSNNTVDVNAILKSYANGTYGGLYINGETYLNAGNTAAGNSYTIGIASDATFKTYPNILDITNCTVNIKNEYRFGSFISSSLVSAGSTIHFLPTAITYFYTWHQVYNNIIVDDNGTVFYFLTDGYASISGNPYSFATKLPSFNNVTIDCNTVFDGSSTSARSLLFNNSLTFTAGHKYITRDESPTVGTLRR